MQDVLDSFEDYKSLFPEILKLEAARMALKLTSSDAGKVNDILMSISVEVSQHAIVDTTARLDLDSEVGAITQLSTTIADSQNASEVEGAIEARESLVRERILNVRNLVARSLKALGHRTLNAAGKGWDKGVENAVEAVTKTGVVALFYGIGGKFLAIAAIVTRLRPLANKVEEVAKPPADPPDDMMDA